MTRRESPSQGYDDAPLDADSQAHTSKFVREYDSSPSTRVIETVAEATETDPLDLQPLYEAIDPDALDQLFESPHRFRRGCIMFEFEGRTVTVDADGSIAVSSRANEGE